MDAGVKCKGTTVHTTSYLHACLSAFPSARMPACLPSAPPLLPANPFCLTARLQRTACQSAWIIGEGTRT